MALGRSVADQQSAGGHHSRGMTIEVPGVRVFVDAMFNPQWSCACLTCLTHIHLLVYPTS